MEQDKLLDRIELNPSVMAGKPVIKGTRLTVQYILNLLAHRATIGLSTASLFSILVLFTGCSYLERVSIIGKIMPLIVSRPIFS